LKRESYFEREHIEWDKFKASDCSNRWELLRAIQGGKISTTRRKEKRDE